MMSSLSVFSAEVLSAKYLPSQNALEIEISYSGGCENNEFTLEHSESCLESFPGQCFAKLIQETNDSCEAMIKETIIVDIEEDKLSGPSFLTIEGDKGSSSKVLIDKEFF